jgi:hypothetical protein
MSKRYTRQVPKHVPPDDVDVIRQDLNKARMSQTKLAGVLGISRTTLHCMFKHELPMRNVYAIAINAVLQENTHG